MNKNKFDTFVKEAREFDDVFAPPLNIPCAKCDGELIFDGFSVNKSCVFVLCAGCGVCYTIGGGKEKT